MHDVWEHLRSFWGRVDEVGIDEATSFSPSGVNPDSVKALNEECKAQNAKLFFSILDTTISGEQMVLFLFVGMILGYGIGAFKSRKRRVAGNDYPRQTPRLPALPHRDVAQRSTRQTRRQHHNRSNLTGRRVPHQRNSFGHIPEFSLTRTLTLAQENDIYYGSEYYVPTAPPRTPMPHSYY
ncbi:unnamed protein product [Orchesella dallaii]|uniref:Uncharacterized protein n=1 Tax=Orchesella dallaii TaxID=48710 RepID=A0ABP1RDL4_9HEXA